MKTRHISIRSFVCRFSANRSRVTFHVSSVFSSRTHLPSEMAAAAKPVLTYFNGRGRGEASRLMFAEGGVEYEDKRVEGKDWPALKASTPFGQMPLLKTSSGQTIAQSGAIERYVAKITKLYGTNDVESAQIDMVCEGIHDAVKKFFEAVFTKDEAEKKTKIEAYFKDEFPRWAGQFTALLKSNKDGKEYFVGNGVSYADILFYHANQSVLGANAKAYDAYPELKALIERVAARPKIAAWLKARPVTSF